MCSTISIDPPAATKYTKLNITSAYDLSRLYSEAQNCWLQNDNIDNSDYIV